MVIGPGDALTVNARDGCARPCCSVATRRAISDIFGGVSHFLPATIRNSFHLLIEDRPRRVERFEFRIRFRQERNKNR